MLGQWWGWIGVWGTPLSRRRASDGTLRRVLSAAGHRNAGSRHLHNAIGSPIPALCSNWMDSLHNLKCVLSSPLLRGFHSDIGREGTICACLRRDGTLQTSWGLRGVRGITAKHPGRECKCPEIFPLKPYWNPRVMDGYWALGTDRKRQCFTLKNRPHSTNQKNIPSWMTDDQKNPAIQCECPIFHHS